MNIAPNASDIESRRRKDYRDVEHVSSAICCCPNRSTDLEATHAWVIAFAGTTIDDPEIAVAVIIEADEAEGEQTGGRVAGPVAQQILSAWLANG